MNILLLTIIILLLIGFGISLYLIRGHYENRIKKVIKSAQKSEQLRSAFLDNASHSLRTPLNAIIGYSNLILGGNNENIQPEQVKELATLINKNGAQMLNYISKLMELSRFDGDKPAFTFIEVNLAELMASYRRETLNITQPNVSVRIKTDLSPHCKAVLDTNYMHQLMMQLLKDAANFTKQGDIIIEYGNERKGLKVTITYSGTSQTELINGDIFSYLQSEDIIMLGNKSSVLGYSFCKAIIDIVGGELDINTENARKTIVSFWIPCKLNDINKR